MIIIIVGKRGLEDRRPVCARARRPLLIISRKTHQCWVSPLIDQSDKKENSFTFLFLSPSHPQSFLTLYPFFRAQLEFRRPELLSDIFAICGPEPVNRRALPFGFAAASGSAALSHPSLFRPPFFLSHLIPSLLLFFSACYSYRFPSYPPPPPFTASSFFAVFDSISPRNS